MPAVLLGMLGADARFQGEGLGAAFLGDAIMRPLNIADAIGSKAIVVDSANDSARDFYAKHGLASIPGPGRMCPPLRLPRVG
jgi:hypothetical protein